MNTFVSLGNSIHRQIKGVPQGGHSSGHMANLTCHFFEREFVSQNPEHPVQHSIFRFMDDFGIANALYFLAMYREIYPLESGIRLVPNTVQLQPGHTLECKFLDLFIYKDTKGTVHITLHDKRFDYAFFVNRFPDADSAASLHQSHDTFFGELVLIFRINTDRTGFLTNIAQTEAYLIFYKRYNQNVLGRLKFKFAKSQQGNSSRFPWTPQGFLNVTEYYLQQELKRLRNLTL